MDMDTQITAKMVITAPAFTMSLIEKYPVKYGITLVGAEVTRINAKDSVKAAGATKSHGFIPDSCATAIITGIITTPVTVLLEKTNFIRQTINAIKKTLKIRSTLVTQPNMSQPIHLAAPVLNRAIPKDRPVAMSNRPPQSTL